ncbi:MAG: hypothetical protein ABR507_12185 [Actinomycetota bacterium]|nr:hypothetical protein [Actinomycetota bacterium]
MWHDLCLPPNGVTPRIDCTIDQLDPVNCLVPGTPNPGDQDAHKDVDPLTLLVQDDETGEYLTVACTTQLDITGDGTGWTGLGATACEAKNWDGVISDVVALSVDVRVVSFGSGTTYSQSGNSSCYACAATQPAVASVNCCASNVQVFADHYIYFLAGYTVVYHYDGPAACETPAPAEVVCHGYYKY